MSNVSYRCFSHVDKSHVPGTYEHLCHDAREEWCDDSTSRYLSGVEFCHSNFSFKMYATSLENVHVGQLYLWISSEDTVWVVIDCVEYMFTKFGHSTIIRAYVSINKSGKSNQLPTVLAYYGYALSDFDTGRLNLIADCT